MWSHPFLAVGPRFTLTQSECIYKEYIYVCKLLVLDRNTWNLIIVWKWVLLLVTWNDMIAYKKMTTSALNYPKGVDMQ